METSHIAKLMKLPLAKIEHKLSQAPPPSSLPSLRCRLGQMILDKHFNPDPNPNQMILDKRFNGILDAGAGCLNVYPDQSTVTLPLPL